MRTLVRVTSAYFCAGVEFGGYGPTLCAPILRRAANGKTCHEFIAYCERRGWRWERLAVPERE